MPGAAAGPRTEALSESASAVKRTDWPSTTGCDRSFVAVAAEPVKNTESWPVRWSKASPRLPHTTWTAPSGRAPESTISRTAASAT